MKILLLLLCALTFGTTLISSSAIVGRNHCSWGPSYWCSNITNAKSCGAVKHCIKAVWEKQHVPEDQDSICQICLDMVKQARDQLESNETMDEIKQVFEGSCDLIPIKVVAKECKNLADDFIPEMVEALSSQMNPQVVCSTAGLCNNAAIDKLLDEYEAQKTSTSFFDCGKCNNIGETISQKFHTSSRDQVLDGFLSACGTLSTFSDACASLVITNFNEIYKELSKNLEAEKICHMSGVCSAKFHQHKPAKVINSIEIKTKSNVGFVKPQDDLPCELCEQLVTHLRDVLVANTTELEFKTVLEGLCKQTKTFSQECVSLVDEYYPKIYEALVNNLDANGACFMIGVCPKGMKMAVPHMPLLPAEMNLQSPRKRLGANEKVYSNDLIKSMVLPIDQLMGAKSSLGLVNGGEYCTICQYFLHFIQEEISNPKTEDEIKEIVGKTCQALPSSVRSQCHEFINLYGDAVIALLVQEVDPRDLCPALKLCPKISIDDVDVFAPHPIDVDINKKKNEPKCPLCMVVVKEAQNLIEAPKSVDAVKKALKKACSPLPPKLQLQCTDFIDSYYDELLDKLVKNFQPHEICIDLKLCQNVEKIPPPRVEVDKKKDTCTICIIAMKKAEDYIENPATIETVKEALKKVCQPLGPKLENQCNNLIEAHYDDFITNLMNGLKPKDICTKINLCLNDDDELFSPADIDTNEIPDFTINGRHVDDIEDSGECMLCVEVIGGAEHKITKGMTVQEIEEILLHECSRFRAYEGVCDNFVKKNADEISDFLEKDLSPKQICQKLSLCAVADQQDLEIDEAIIVNVVAIPANTFSFGRVSLTNNEPPKSIKDDPTCVLCEFIMTKLEQELKDKTTQDEIKNAVLNICSKMPNSISKSCSKFVSQYADLIISLIDTVPPKQICTQMSLCAAIKTPAHLVGDSECTWGPSHFCSDTQIADKCKATEYCKQRKLGMFA